MDLTYDDYCVDRRGYGWRQKDLTPRVVYDGAYLRDRYVAIDNQVKALAEARLRVLEAFAAVGMPDCNLLDYGTGTGRFVEAACAWGWRAVGYDLVPGAGPRIADPSSRKWDVVTFFDVLEHLPDPAATIEQLRPRWLMISVPECHSPCEKGWFMRWKHRRPGEHLWHWNRGLLRLFLERLRYREVMTSCFEDDYRPRYDPALPNILTGIYCRAAT